MAYEVKTQGSHDLSFRNGVELRDPLTLALLFLQNDYSYRTYDAVAVPPDNVLREEDARLANSIGARMSSAQIAAIFERRPAIETALAAIPGRTSLAANDAEIPWDALQALYAAAWDIPGVGLAKMTKVLHKKRPHLIPMLDSLVCRYLRSVDGIMAGRSAEAALELTRSYKRDLDANRDALSEVQAELADRGYELTLCRILDLFTWSTQVTRFQHGRLEPRSWLCTRRNQPPPSTPLRWRLFGRLPGNGIRPRRGCSLSSIISSDLIRAVASGSGVCSPHRSAAAVCRVRD